MSIADHFDPEPDAGFVRSYDAQSARRQFRVSVALILVLGLAVGALGLLGRLDQPMAPTQFSSVKTSNVHFAETLLDIPS